MTRTISGLFVATALAAALGTAGPAAAQEFKLRWGHYLPNTKFVQVEKDFAEAVKERTDGRVEIEITFAGGLGKGNEIMTLAGRGAIDMASVVPGYYPDQLLFWKAYQIPFIFDTPREAMEVSAASYDALPVFQDELDKYDVKFLFHQPLGSYYMTGPDPNCDTVEGLKGKKIRSFGADIPKIFEAIDAVPVSVGFNDIYEAVQRGTAEVKKRAADPMAPTHGLDDDELAKIGRAVGIGAVKYADLSSELTRDYVFNFDRMIAFEGNTGPYIQYAHARICSIFAKAGEADAAIRSAPIAIAEPAEKDLALLLLRYNATVHAVSEALEPHRLCTYLYDLANAYSAFYQSCPVIKADDEATRRSRLRLCAITRDLIADGLALLGIDAPTRM